MTDHTANLCACKCETRLFPGRCTRCVLCAGFDGRRINVRGKSIRTCEFQSGVSGEKKKRGRWDEKVLRTSNTTALICCIRVVNVQHRHGTCRQGEIGEGVVDEWAGAQPHGHYRKLPAMCKSADAFCRKPAPSTTEGVHVIEQPSYLSSSLSEPCKYFVKSYRHSVLSDGWTYAYTARLQEFARCDIRNRV